MPVGASALALVAGACGAGDAGRPPPAPGPDAVAFVDRPEGRGDDPVLDRLLERCEDDDLAACEELWWASPVGTDYERIAGAALAQGQRRFGR